MKIGAPVKRKFNGIRRGKYAGIFAAVDALADGEWLPVECADTEEKRKVQSSIVISSKLKGKPYESRTEGNTVYFRRYAEAP